MSAAFVGGLSVGVVPAEVAAKLVNGLYMSTLLSLLWLRVQKLCNSTASGTGAVEKHESRNMRASEP
eukprot:1740394-Amphidinium_carterae.2